MKKRTVLVSIALLFSYIFVVFQMITATADGVSPAYITFKSLGVETTGGLINDEEIKYTHSYGVDKIYKYDTVASFNDCNEIIGTAILSEDTSPDGTKYLTAADEDICFPGLGENLVADIMWEADVRFNEEGNGVSVYNEGDVNLRTCIIRNDDSGSPMLSTKTGSASFTRYAEIDPTKWYHVVLMGSYSSSYEKIDLIIYEYDENGEKVFINKFEGIYVRGIGNRNGASHWNVHSGTSVDNLKITLLGADFLEVISDEEAVKAGDSMQLYCNATRQGQYVATPEVKWKIYNAYNTEPLADENITITEDGTLNVGFGTSSQIIYIRATAQSGISAYKRIYIGEIEFDMLTLSAEKNYVSATKPLTITPTATKDGQAVELINSDLIWYVTDSTDTMRLGDDLKWIKIENGVLTVDERAVTQDITICASDPQGYVKGSIPIHIKATDALEGEEVGNGNKVHFSSNCESELEGTEFVESIDGTHAYRVTKVLKTGSVQTNTEMTIEMDIKFEQEGAGVMPMHHNRVGVAIVYHNGMLAIQTGNSDFVSYCEISPDTWYHITDSSSNLHHTLTVEEYDDDGNRINKQEFENVNQRSDNTFSGVRINTGTVYDNLRVLIPENATEVPVYIDVTEEFADKLTIEKIESDSNGFAVKILPIGDNELPVLNFYTAIYDENGALKRVEITPCENSNGDITQYMPKPDVAENEIYKLMLWTDEYVPIIEAIDSKTTGFFE